MACAAAGGPLLPTHNRRVVGCAQSGGHGEGAGPEMAALYWLETSSILPFRE
jgi:hypothetical protein